MTDQVDQTVLPIRRPPFAGVAGKAPFAFTGTVKKVVFDVAPHPDGQDEDALHVHAQQAHTARGINA